MRTRAPSPARPTPPPRARARQAALAQTHFRDVAARRIELPLEPATAAAAWPALLDFLYADRLVLDDGLVLPLLALARRLMVTSLDGYCVDYVQRRLCTANCVVHLRLAVRYALHDLHAECVALAAKGGLRVRVRVSALVRARKWAGVVQGMGLGLHRVGCREAGAALGVEGDGGQQCRWDQAVGTDRLGRVCASGLHGQ